ncbi:hypothetical protein Y032_0087g2088 [Ancylostoma ceylanicum]|nr:hypothetical protein Y032_0087g2088 [Ancylostoma ceylanicum]
MVIFLRDFELCIGVRSGPITKDTCRSLSDLDRYVSFVIRSDRTPMHYNYSLTLPQKSEKQETSRESTYSQLQ